MTDKYTDQTNQTLIPILIEPLLGILIAQSEKDQESIQSITTPDPGHHMGKGYDDDDDELEFNDASTLLGH